MEQVEQLRFAFYWPQESAWQQQDFQVDIIESQRALMRKVATGE
jgi:hypothetical protein